ncbi:MAG: hypothetical protein ABIH65_01990 [Nanoarchaeota archaeon]
MANRINIFLRTLREVFIGFLFLFVFLITLSLVISIIKLIFPSIPLDFSILLNVLGWIVVICLGLYVYNLTKRDEDRREYERQISLLESLYSELDAISSKKKEISTLNKKISTHGNLQWVKELFEQDLKPAHGIWNLNTPNYIVGLNREVMGKKTKLLKDALIHISQKIELIGNYILQYNQIPQKVNKEYSEPIKEVILKVLNETIGLVDETKEFIKKEFKLDINQ